MSEKGTLGHATTRWEWCEGISRLHGLALVVGEGGGDRFEGEGERLWSVFE